MIRRPARLPPLAMLIAIGMANHVVLNGSRVAVSLDALALGGSAATVGALMALYAVLPMLLSIPAGRLADRIGARTPMLVGSCGVAVAAVLPAIFPGLWTLFVSASLLGVGFMAFQVPAQYATGEMGGPAERTRNFGLLALGYSTSAILGPLAAGILIDAAGYRWAFGVLAVAPLLPIVVLGANRLPLPGPHPAHAGTPARNAFDLLTHKGLRRVLIVNALVSMAWELLTVFVPLFGNSIGLSASQIGLILASFATATFIVRLAVPVIVRSFEERRVMMTALLIGGAVYLAIPFSRHGTTLMALSFVLGLGMGVTQPMVLAALHSHAPPGRLGEVTGLRMSLVNLVAVTVPLAFGAVGSTVGLAPVLWAVGMMLTGGGLYARRA
jgi:MFS family permease